jgi:nucleoside-diphosphate-sugar epimerase
MPRIAIAGYGYLGRAIADIFRTSGWEVEGWARQPIEPHEIPTRVVDITRSVPRDKHFDVIVHCASTRGGDAEAYRRVYLEGVRNILVAAATPLLVFTSSTSVYAQRDGDWVNEDSAAEPTTESGKILREAEKLVLAAGGIVPRLAGLYGPGRSFLLRSVLDGTARAAADRYLNQIHRDDAAAAIFTLATSASVRGQIFNVADDTPMLRNECLTWLASVVGRSIETSDVAAATRRKRGDSNKRVSNQRLRAVGWTPQFPSYKCGLTDSVLPSLEQFGC